MSAELYRVDGTTIGSGESLKSIVEENARDLQGADLRFTDLYGTKLRGAKLRNANLMGSFVRHADLQSADLYHADLRWTKFDGSILRYAMFSGALFRDNSFIGAILNWQSHDLMSAVLMSCAGTDVMHRSFAGLIRVSPDRCWTDFRDCDHPAVKWAADALRPWVTNDLAHAPTPLIEYLGKLPGF